MRVQSSGFRVQGSGFRVQGSGFRVQGSEFRVQGSGFRIQGSGCRVYPPACPTWRPRDWRWRRAHVSAPVGLASGRQRTIPARPLPQAWWRRRRRTWLRSLNALSPGSTCDQGSRSTLSHLLSLERSAVSYLVANRRLLFAPPHRFRSVGAAVAVHGCVARTPFRQARPASACV